VEEQLSTAAKQLEERNMKLSHQEEQLTAVAQQLAASEEQVRLLAHKEKELEEIRSELQVLSAVF
jgi:hypothetical protein